MGASTKIEWTDFSFNPWWGCARVSRGCGGAQGVGGCYAETFAHRLGLEIWGQGSPRRFFGEDHWREPIKWDRSAKTHGLRRRVFCASMADVFEERSDLDPWRNKLWALIEATPNLDWLLLTKRPENIEPMTPPMWQASGWPPHVWMGTTIEDQTRADLRLPILNRVKAAVRFVSYEPALEDIDLGIDVDATSRPYGLFTCPKCHGWGGTLASLYPDANGHEQINECGHCDSSGCATNWLIAGGESGPGARPFDLNWARHMLAQCRSADVPVFVKQMGSHPVDSPCPRCAGNDPDLCGLCAGGNIVYPKYADPKGGDITEWPEPLRIREFPTTERAPS